MKIAVLDDDLLQLQMIEQALIGGDNQWGEEVECRFFSSGMALLEVVKKEYFDCLILDRRIPDMSGDVILQWVRQYGEQVHQDYSIVMMFSSIKNEGEVVNSFSLGANDYILKPFRPSELVARIKQLLETKRRLTENHFPVVNSSNKIVEHLDNEVSLYGYTFQPFTHSVLTPLGTVQMTERVFSLALLMFRNAGRSLSRKSIFEQVWKRVDSGTSDRTLDTHIHRVRQQLDLTVQRGILLKPVYGFGYRLDVTHFENTKSTNG